MRSVCSNVSVPHKNTCQVSTQYVTMSVCHKETPASMQAVCDNVNMNYIYENVNGEQIPVHSRLEFDGDFIILRQIQRFLQTLRKQNKETHRLYIQKCHY